VHERAHLALLDDLREPTLALGGVDRLARLTRVERLLEAIVDEPLEAHVRVGLDGRRPDVAAELAEEVGRHRLLEVLGDALLHAFGEQLQRLRLDVQRVAGRREDDDERVPRDHELGDDVGVAQVLARYVLEGLRYLAHDLVEDLPAVDLLDLAVAYDVETQKRDLAAVRQQRADPREEERGRRQARDRVEQQLAQLGVRVDRLAEFEPGLEKVLAGRIAACVHQHPRSSLIAIGLAVSRARGRGRT
jgi:hypothetical protein